MKKLLLLLLCVPLIGVGQQTYVPDDNFEDYLEANGMGNGVPNDDYVTTSNINTVTYLSVTTQNISDLTGIEDFISLEDLYCMDNQLTSLDLSNNINLNYLNCENNQLISLDVSQNTSLFTLKCSYNQLISLNLSANINLDQVRCFSNQITSIDVSKKKDSLKMVSS